MLEDVVKKLKYKSGRAIVLFPPEGFRLGIETDERLEGKFEFVLLFVNDAKETIERLKQVIPFLADDAVFWVTYPKQSSKVKTDINRDILWKLIQEHSEYTLVSNVSIDEKWSSVRARHVSKTSKKS